MFDVFLLISWYVLGFHGELINASQRYQSICDVLSFTTFYFFILGMSLNFMVKQKHRKYELMCNVLSFMALWFRSFDFP